MGYEIKLTYAEKLEDGYDRDNPKTVTRKVGDPFDDISLEKLASRVFAQLARRDIIVLDVEIFEYAKKRITFKETKGGIIIKNKKFHLDDGTLQCTNELIDEPVTEITISNGNPMQQQMPQMQSPKQSPIVRPPLRWEVFDPDPNYVSVLLQKGFKMTPKKKYPIMGEQSKEVIVNNQGIPEPVPMFEYSVIDDQGQMVWLPSVHFVPEQRGLIGQALINQAEGNRYAPNQPRLLYQGGSAPPMPVIRR